MTDCLFCKIINGELSSEIVYEDADYISIVDIHPNNFGHSLLIPKEHYENIYTLGGSALARYGEVLKKISTAVKKAVNADGINVYQNNDAAAGQIIFHQHTHIIPRFKDDGLKHFDTKKYEHPDQVKEIGKKIRESIG